jgi:NADPH-dependent 7-cyano-7-deazaguanine reductase QueF-like protein
MPRTSRSAAALPKATLGKRRATPFTYTPSLLEAIPFSLRRGFTGQTTLVANRCERRCARASPLAWQR